VRLLTAVILFISLLLLLTSQPSLAQSSIAKGTDSTVQVFPLIPSDIEITKPENLTKIQSPEEAEDLLDKFKLTPDSAVCVPGTAVLLHTAEWQVSSTSSSDTDPSKVKTEYTFKLTASQWTGFSARYKNGKCKLKQSFRADKSPLFYGDSSVYLIAINYFDNNSNGVYGSHFQNGLQGIDYSLNTAE
jgi:hypothetical protein